MAFRWFFKKKRVQQEEVREPAADSEQEVLEDEAVEVNFEREKVDLRDDKARLSYLQRLYDVILEAKRQCGDIKFEYGQVTSYLKDIQLIDQAPVEDKQELLAAARRIVELLKEREYLQKQRYKMTDAQRRAMETYEAIVFDDIQKLQEYEEYQMKIKNDLRQLGSEKNLLLADKADIIKRQKTLKSIGKVLAILLVAFGSMLLALLFCFKVDITVPFLATAAFAFVIAAIILNEARKNRIDMVITERKCNRAIALSNKVKLKYYNNVRTLDYMNHKYQVRNATELDFVFGQYRKAKREWARQREGTIQLHEMNQILIQQLQNLGVKDKEIWYSQARALFEPKEMVEIRHELNVRRQKLREQLEYNTGIIEQCVEEMERIKDQKPEYAQEVDRFLGER